MPEERLRAIWAGIAAQRHSVSQDTDPFIDGDSIEQLEAILAIEAELGVTLPEDQLQGVRDLAQLDALVESALTAKVNAPPSRAAQAAVPSEHPFPHPPLPPTPTARWSTPFAAAVSILTRFWFRLTVSGLEHLPADQPCLLCANHSSHLDSVALLAATGNQRDRLVFAAAKDYFFSHPRLTRTGTNLLALLPWERGGNLAAMKENLRHLAACREATRIVVFFPEGTRSPDGVLQPFREGLPFFATQSRLPIVPCWIQGTHRALSKGSRWPRPGLLSVRFGPTITAAPNAPGFTAAVRDALVALQPQPTS